MADVIDMDDRVSFVCPVCGFDSKVECELVTDPEEILDIAQHHVNRCYAKLSEKVQGQGQEKKKPEEAKPSLWQRFVNHVRSGKPLISLSGRMRTEPLIRISPVMKTKTLEEAFDFNFGPATRINSGKAKAINPLDEVDFSDLT